MILFEHSVPLLFLVITLILAVGAAAYSAWRYLPRHFGGLAIVVLHLLFLGLLTWCLLMPGRKDVITQALRPRFIVALDTSGSMLLRPTEESFDRWTEARRALAMGWADVLRTDCELEVYSFAAEVSPTMTVEEARQLQPQGEATLLRDSLNALADSYAGLNVAGMLLLSDGLDTREAYDDWAADERPFPVYTVRLEPEAEWEKEAELRVDAVTTPRRVTQGWTTELKAVISGQGTGGQAVTVQLLKDGQVIQEKPTQIPSSGGERELLFDLDHPDLGSSTYRVRAVPLPGEQVTSDNEFAVSVLVTDARNRLLYVEGTPRWEYKFLKRALTANRQTTPVIFHTGVDGAPRAGVPAGPFTADMSESELDQFKIVILGDLTGEELLEGRARNLTRFVESGGSLVLLGGARAWGADGLPSTPLGGILPVRGHAPEPLEGERPFDVQLTDAARSHPAFAGDTALWETIPPILSLIPGAELSPGAQVLVTAQTPGGPQPVVASHRYGQGKVTVILTDSLWRWQLDADSGADKPYLRFWTQLISWLLPADEDTEGDALDFFADRDRLFLGEVIDLNARLADEIDSAGATVRCEITLPDGRKLPYTMAPQQVIAASGRTYPGFALPFTADQPGLYRAVATAELGGVTREAPPFSFFVQPFSPETAPRPIKTDVLQALADRSGGQFFDTLEQMDGVLSSLDTNPLEEETSEYRSLWQTWPLIILMMILLTAMWATRKLRNMP